MFQTFLLIFSKEIILTGNIHFFAYFDFKFSVFLLGQGVVELIQLISETTSGKQIVNNKEWLA